MTAFWIISGVFIVVALLFVLPTLLRSREIEVNGVEHDSVNVRVYRDQLAELENDLLNDILTQEQYEKSKQELQQRMLQDVPEGEKMTIKKKTKKIHNIAISSVITLALPITAVFLYLLLGDTRGLLPQAQLANATQMKENARNNLPEGHEGFSSVLDNLVARLNDNPDDIEGWVMLGRTYAIMGRFDEASNTYTRLVELVPDSPQILSDYADVLAMKNQGSLAGKPTELINEALRIDPEYPKALALAGTADFEQARYDQAADHWEKLLAVIPADSELAKSVSESIAEARSLAANDESGSVSTLQAQQAEENPKQQPDTDTSNNNEPASISISGTVELSPVLASKASPNDTLFIYARAKTGPKMPLAILRLKASDLPATFTLTDDMAMTPAMKLSSFPEVVVEARITKTGQAVPTSGDLQGFSQPVKVGKNDIAIVIDQQVP